jgi:hypothetical protein
MYNFFYEGIVPYQTAFWMLLSVLIICLIILLYTICIHFNNQRTNRKLAAKNTVYENLVTSVRAGYATDEDIVKALPPEDYTYFQRFLQESISTIQNIDVSAERKIAEISGFMDDLKNNISRSRKWDKVLAVRTLSYFRDSANIPLFEKIQEEKGTVQTLYAATLGLALCRDRSTFRSQRIRHRLWQLLKNNPMPLLTILTIYGEVIAPDINDILLEDELIDEEKGVFIKFLGEVQYRNAVPAIAGMLETEKSHLVRMACLSALGKLGDESVLPGVLPFLDNEDFTLRIAALHTTARVGGESCLAHMESRLDDENWWVRREAALALAHTGRIGVSRLRAIAEGIANAPRIAAKGILAELRFNRIPGDT